MIKLFNKIIKKEDMISDHGVHQKGNHVDVAVITFCVLICIVLIYLGFKAYTY